MFSLMIADAFISLSPFTLLIVVFVVYFIADLL
jgi:hypothetical protein